MAVAIARTISKPIKDLTAISQVIAGGHLSARAAVTTSDEIGLLAQSFNQMTDRLIEAKTDIENKKKEVEEQKHLLEKVNKELDSFVYTASHDLRAPLRAIDGFSSFLQRDHTEKLDEKALHYIERIRAGTKKMNDLIDDLLDLSRISRVQNPFEDVSMRDLINTVLERIEFDIKQHNVDVVIAQQLPIVHCDRIKITEAVFNLVSNAIKFSSKANPAGRPRVEVGYADDGQMHCFFVKDNGIGIDKKYHQEIFEIFRRLHTSDEYEGTGAGLTIVKKIIDDHGGSIWVESNEGAGAAFFFTLPKTHAGPHQGASGA
jgi:light-regulated signal transduction histidine kinase (bacteriophytochrome)